MRHKLYWLMLIVLIAGLIMSSCSDGGETAEKESPVHLESIEGSEFQRVVLTQKAAERLDIQTAPVQEDSVARKRLVGGKVLASPPSAGGEIVLATGQEAGTASTVANPGKVWVLISLNASDLSKVDRGQPVRILPFGDDGEDDDMEEGGLFAEPDEGDNDDDNGDDNGDSALLYALEDPGQSVEAGQLVRVELPLMSNGPAHKVVPYSAVLYGLHGETWVYTNPEPLVYIRYPVTVDYIDGDQAVLLDGPPAGMAVVTVGSAELFGAESGVGGGH